MASVALYFQYSPEAQEIETDPEAREVEKELMS
jgi:hypothetical protein